MICILVTVLVAAQQNTVSGGGDLSGAGGTMSISLGQLDYVYQSGINGSLNQGVQQPGQPNTGCEDVVHIVPSIFGLLQLVQFTL